MGKPENKPFVLAGDIGGTKTNMGLFQKGKSRPILKHFEIYSSREAANLEEIIQQFLKKHAITVACAAFGIAGPVFDGRCKTTNLPWDVSEDRIKKRFGWPCVNLINDLAATALAIPMLSSKEVLLLNRATSRKKKNIALIAPGTGLGEALLIFQNGNYVPLSSEGGHADFAPNSDIEVELWKHLHKRFGHVSVERVLSGPGLFNIYSWLKDSGRYREPSWLSQKIKEEDPARVITDAALDDKDSLCVEALKMFASILGAVSGNLALTGMTTGGVYLGGGIPPKILPILKKGLFMNAFKAKGRFSDMLEKIPVKVILNDRAALMGAATHAFKMLR
jgi:glucokinase